MIMMPNLLTVQLFPPSPLLSIFRTRYCWPLSNHCSCTSGPTGSNFLAPCRKQRLRRNNQRKTTKKGYVCMISHTLKSSNLATQPRTWKCGEPYQYSIPEPDGNPWEVVLEALLKKDKIQCDAWKDEVQNLLIFVGYVFEFLICRASDLILQGWTVLCGSNGFHWRILQVSPPRLRRYFRGSPSTHCYTTWSPRHQHLGRIFEPLSSDNTVSPRNIFH